METIIKRKLQQANVFHNVLCLEQRERNGYKYEKIILLEVFICVKEGVLERKKAILEVSRILRMKAQNEGLEVDSVFRNEAGITF